MEIFKKNMMQELFENAVRGIINVLILYIIVVLVFGLLKTLLSITAIIQPGLAHLDLSYAVTDILTFLVMIELFRSFIEYFKAKRIRLHTMIDPAIIFIIRELIVMLYSHVPLEGRSLAGFAFLLLALGVIRTLAVVFSPDEEKV
jgi:uncharacterized membrane protein (DUF373 family)